MINRKKAQLAAARYRQNAACPAEPPTSLAIQRITKAKLSAHRQPPLKWVVNFFDMS